MSLLSCVRFRLCQCIRMSPVGPFVVAAAVAVLGFATFAAAAASPEAALESLEDWLWVYSEQLVS